MEKFDDAAIRHFVDAKHLQNVGCLDNAGHLIGFAAECAIKYSITTLKSPPENPPLHLPQLLTAARKHLGARGARKEGIYAAIQEDILNGWQVGNRYSPTGHIKEERLEIWVKQTQRLFAAARLKVKQ